MCRLRGGWTLRQRQAWCSSRPRWLASTYCRCRIPRQTRPRRRRVLHKTPGTQTLVDRKIGRSGDCCQIRRVQIDGAGGTVIHRSSIHNILSIYQSANPPILQCLANTRVAPLLSNDMTSYACGFVPGYSIPGEPTGMPPTAIPRIAGFSFNIRWTSAAGTCPSTT